MKLDRLNSDKTDHYNPTRKVKFLKIENKTGLTKTRPHPHRCGSSDRIRRSSHDRSVQNKARWKLQIILVLPSSRILLHFRETASTTTHCRPLHGALLHRAWQPTSLSYCAERWCTPTFRLVTTMGSVVADDTFICSTPCITSIYLRTPLWRGATSQHPCPRATMGTA